jgi:hypothetical protein
MYLISFVVSTVVGLTAAVAAMGLGSGGLRSADRRGRPSALAWASMASGLAAAGLVLAATVFPRLRGREPSTEGAPFEPTPYTDPFVISCGVGVFALAVGLFAIARGDRGWPAWAGLAAGGGVGGVWLFYLLGRLLG